MPLLYTDLTSRAALCGALGNAVSHGSSGSAPPFGALATSLASDLEPLIDAALPIPDQKARLTRIGGRCPTHGILLDFDPWSPHAHRCSRCDRMYVAREHDDWWAMGAQLFTAERAVHAAALYAVRRDPRHATLAARILDEYSDRYFQWPNIDNVLGPTGPFFSTYLESIWLLNLCHAAALLEAVGAAAVWSQQRASRLRDRVIEPSATLIDGYFEGRSNRQVWNEVAVCSAWRLLGRDERARERLRSPTGIAGLLEEGLDPDGFWYEGENYHLFAHRGLWYGVELMRALDMPLSAEQHRRYAAGFVAPFLGLLPDETFPSRRDSQYASSIRQWRTAEWCELGWAYAGDRRLAGILTRLYDGSLPRRETGRATSTADAERNYAPTSLTRADLSWRALLMAAPDSPSAHATPARSVCLPSQGLAVIRRDDGNVYIALEGGQSGGGHGHPDALSLTLQAGAQRWLQDPGAGSYTEAKLAWYRSTWAHHAPLVDGQSQREAVTALVAFSDAAPRDDDVPSWGYMVKRAEGIATGVDATRHIVVGDGYLVDLLECATVDDLGAEHEIILPIAAAAEMAGPSSRWHRQPFAEDETDLAATFMKQVEVRVLDGTAHLRAFASVAGDVRSGVEPTVNETREPSHGEAVAEAHVWYAADQPARLHRALVPAPPGQGEVMRHWLSTKGRRVRVIGIWSWPTATNPSATVCEATLALDGQIRADITLVNGETHIHERIGDAWHVRRHSESGITTHVLRDTFDLDATGGAGDTPRRTIIQRALGDTTQPQWRLHVPVVMTASSALGSDIPGSTPSRDSSSASTDLPGEDIPGAHTVVLGEPHYVGTELPWQQSGRPSARVQLAVVRGRFTADIAVFTGAPVVPPESVENPLDNEPNDTNADGVQWYLGGPPRVGAPLEWHAAGLIVPLPAAPDPDACRHTRVVGSGCAPSARWRRLPDGWAMRLTWDVEDLPLSAEDTLRFDLVVNERPPERARRRGQLVLSGGGGFGYLAGPRRQPDRYVLLTVVPPRGKTTSR